MTRETCDEHAAEPESTVELLARARAGDEAALDEVFTRAIPLLKRWASGRLPLWARDMVDTDDLVQETVVSTLKHIDVFEYRMDSALQAYLRQAVMNRIRNEIRRATPASGIRDARQRGARRGVIAARAADRQADAGRLSCVARPHPVRPSGGR